MSYEPVYNNWRERLRAARIALTLWRKFESLEHLRDSALWYAMKSYDAGYEAAINERKETDARD